MYVCYNLLFVTLLLCVCEKVQSRHRRLLPFSSNNNRVEKRDIKTEQDNEILTKDELLAATKNNNVGNDAKMEFTGKERHFKEDGLRKVKPIGEEVKPIKELKTRRTNDAKSDDDAKEDNIEPVPDDDGGDPDMALAKDVRRIDPYVTKKPPMPKRMFKNPDCSQEIDEKKYSTPFMPRHIEKMYYRVTPRATHYPVGKVPALGYHPPPVKMTECERLYLEHMRQKQYYSDSNSSPDESKEYVRSVVGDDKKI